MTRRSDKFLQIERLVVRQFRPAYHLWTFYFQLSTFDYRPHELRLRYDIGDKVPVGLSEDIRAFRRTISKVIHRGVIGDW